MRMLYLAAGVALVGLAVIGAVLPLMPSTIFLILAAGAFARSSPRLEAWLLNHARLGPPIRAWRANGAIAPAGKAFALGGMAVGYGVFLATSSPWWPIALAVGVALAACAGFVASRPNG